MCLWKRRGCFSFFFLSSLGCRLCCLVLGEGVFVTLFVGGGLCVAPSWFRVLPLATAPGQPGVHSTL